MTRQQRLTQRSHFERLCFLRSLYRLRGAYDSVGCISVEAAIQAAESALARVDTPASVESNQPAGQSSSRPPEIVRRPVSHLASRTTEKRPS